MDQAGSLGDFADKPLVVLTAGSRSDAAWSAAQNDLPTLSPNSVHRVIDGTTHISLIVDEDDAAATTQAILDVVSWVRSAGRWSGEAQPREDLDLLVLALDGPGCKPFRTRILTCSIAASPTGHRGIALLSVPLSLRRRLGRPLPEVRFGH